MPTVAETITRIREDRGWTRYRLSKEAGISTDAVLLIESGARQPSLATAAAIAKALRCSLAVFDCAFAEEP